MKDITEIYNSVGEFYRTINSRPVSETFSVRGSSLASTIGSEEFCGTPNIEAANELLLNGDEKNARNIQAVQVNKIGSVAYKKQITTDVAGFAPCIPAYLSGRPRNMYAVRKKPVKTNIITLCVNVDVCKSITVAKATEAGAKILSLINTLEQRNIRVNLYVGGAATVKGQKTQLLVKVKDAGAPLNIMRAAYCIVNPSFLRRHLFKWLETLPHTSKKFLRAYGGADKFTPGIIPEAKIIDIKDIIYHGMNIETLADELAK